MNGSQLSPTDVRMRRIGLAVAISFSLALATLAGEAQPNAPVRTIGILAGTPEASRVFEQGLRDLGWIEGQNVRFARHVSTDYQRLLRLASELTRIPVDVIFAGNAPSIRAAMEASKTVPIISVSGDP